MTAAAPWPLAAAFAYWAVVFAAGFILGTFRVLELAPRFGDVVSVALELPVMLVFSWIASRRICRLLAVPGRPGPRLLMGGLAFALLIGSEVALAVFAFGQTAEGWVGSLANPAGLLGLAGQVGFGMIPAVQAALQREI